MSEPNFEDILSRNSDAIKPPPPIPPGSYLWQIQGLYKQDKSPKKGTPYVEFTAAIVQPMDDVDQSALAEFEGGVQGKTRTLTFYLTEDSIFRLKDFLVDDLKIEGGRSMKEMLAETPGKAFVGRITHSPGADGKSVYANINGTTAA